MLTQPATQEDIATRLNPLPSPRSPWRVSAVAVLPDYRLKVQFLDGTEGIVDLAALVHSPNAGVFASLSDPQRFAEVRVEMGAVSWPGGVDLAPDAMYAEIKRSGTWVMGEKLTRA